MHLLLYGQDNVSADLVVTLTRILFPIVAILGMTGVVTGILNSERIFGVPAFAPVAWNLVIILALVLFARGKPLDEGVEVYAWGVLVATVVQFLIPLPLLRGRGTGPGMAAGVRQPDVRRILRLMIPVSIGLGLININLTLDTVIAIQHSGSAAADLDFAFRLFMLPQGLFSVAVSTVLFPELARRAAQRDLAGVGADRLGRVADDHLPAVACGGDLDRPGAAARPLLFQHGEFSASATDAVSLALMAFSLGLVGQRAVAAADPRLLQPAAAGRPDPRRRRQPRAERSARRRPAGLRRRRHRPVDVIVTAFNATVLAIALRSRVGSLHCREVRRHTARIAVADPLLRRGGVRRLVAARPAAGTLVPGPGGDAGRSAWPPADSRTWRPRG